MNRRERVIFSLHNSYTHNSDFKVLNSIIQDARGFYSNPAHIVSVLFWSSISSGLIEREVLSRTSDPQCFSPQPGIDYEKLSQEGADNSLQYKNWPTVEQTFYSFLDFFLVDIYLRDHHEHVPCYCRASLQREQQNIERNRRAGQIALVLLKCLVLCTPEVYSASTIAVYVCVGVGGGC